MRIRIFALCGAAVCAALAASPSIGAQLGRLPIEGTITSEVTKVYDDDDWHNRWRSHHRRGSDDRDWHNRWRSHHRWGSTDYDYRQDHGADVEFHSRWRSHYRWGSRREY